MKNEALTMGCCYNIVSTTVHTILYLGIYMDTRIQFRIEPEIKTLAKQALKKKGVSLSDALRSFVSTLASTEKDMTKEDAWLKEQIEDTFERVARGDNVYYSEDEAEERMNAFILKIEKQEQLA